MTVTPFDQWSASRRLHEDSGPDLVAFLDQLWEADRRRTEQRALRDREGLAHSIAWLGLDPTEGWSGEALKPHLELRHAELVRESASASANRDIDPDDVWGMRPVLSSILANSRRRILTPWAVLGNALVRALHTVPPTTLYRSGLGSASLNLGVVALGETGSGKSRAGRMLDECLVFIGSSGEPVRFRTLEVGSGEAIAEAYAHRAGKGEEGDADGLVWEHRAVMFGFDEVGRLEKLGTRQGSTVIEYVKSGLTGEELGRSTVNRGGVQLPRDSYRMTAIINAQPARTGSLLNESEIAGGFPGRLIWMPTTDADADDDVVGDTDDDVVGDEPFVAKHVDWSRIPEVNATPTMDLVHMREMREQIRGGGDPLDSHATMARVRVAVALMVLDARTFLSDEDWVIAGAVMTKSRATRAVALAALHGAATSEARRVGALDAERRDGAYEAAVERTVKRVEEYLAEGVPMSKMQSKLSKG